LKDGRTIPIVSLPVNPVPLIKFHAQNPAKSLFFWTKPKGDFRAALNSRLSGGITTIPAIPEYGHKVAAARQQTCPWTVH
jgi:hypothetical protein